MMVLVREVMLKVEDVQYMVLVPADKSRSVLVFGDSRVHKLSEACLGFNQPQPVPRSIHHH